MNFYATNWNIGSYDEGGLILESLPALPDGIEVNDPNDAFLLAMALAGDADYLVTGDRRAGLLQHDNIGRTRIVTPAGFCGESL